MSCGTRTHCTVGTARPYRPKLITYQPFLSRVTLLHGHTRKYSPPDSFKKVVNYAKKHIMALISGTDANAHNTYWNNRITDKAGADRGNSFLSYILSQG